MQIDQQVRDLLRKQQEVIERLQLRFQAQKEKEDRQIQEIERELQRRQIEREQQQQYDKIQFKEKAIQLSQYNEKIKKSIEELKQMMGSIQDDNDDQVLFNQNNLIQNKNKQEICQQINHYQQIIKKLNGQLCKDDVYKNQSVQQDLKNLSRMSEFRRKMMTMW